MILPRFVNHLPFRSNAQAFARTFEFSFIFLRLNHFFSVRFVLPTCSIATRDNDLQTIKWSLKNFFIIYTQAIAPSVLSIGLTKLSNPWFIHTLTYIILFDRRSTIVPVDKTLFSDSEHYHGQWASWWRLEWQ